ncbi:hypothetical protein C8J56DRAFT_890179 [Mycena floridula]|nr:hypothetical protein C8J56DRAFT_890179 [Mycena floridula]
MAVIIPDTTYAWDSDEEGKFGVKPRPSITGLSPLGDFVFFAHIRQTIPIICCMGRPIVLFAEMTQQAACYDPQSRHGQKLLQLPKYYPYQSNVEDYEAHLWARLLGASDFVGTAIKVPNGDIHVTLASWPLNLIVVESSEEPPRHNVTLRHAPPAIRNPPTCGALFGMPSKPTVSARPSSAAKIG